MAEAFFCDAVRSPIGTLIGIVSKVCVDDLTGFGERNAKVDWAAIDDVMLACANQAGEGNRDVARIASLLPGLPESVPRVAVNRLVPRVMSVGPMLLEGV
jgi:acetyl-CoA C-acetyltransferase